MQSQPTQSTQPAQPAAAVQALYQQLIATWNQRDAAAMAALYTPDGAVVGFDGSQMNGRAQIAAEIGAIFAQHRTAPYITKIREVRLLTPEVALVRAVAGMIPPGQSAINPAVNAIHSMVAVLTGDQWRVALFQNTPAQFHGRPELVEQLTAELQALVG